MKPSNEKPYFIRKINNTSYLTIMSLPSAPNSLVKRLFLSWLFPTLNNHVLYEKILDHGDIDIERFHPLRETITVTHEDGTFSKFYVDKETCVLTIGPQDVSHLLELHDGSFIAHRYGQCLHIKNGQEKDLGQEVIPKFYYNNCDKNCTVYIVKNELIERTYCHCNSGMKGEDEAVVCLNSEDLYEIYTTYKIGGGGIVEDNSFEVTILFTNEYEGQKEYQTFRYLPEKKAYMLK